MKKPKDDSFHFGECIPLNSTTFQVLLTKGTEKERSVLINENAVFFSLNVNKLTCRTFLLLCLWLDLSLPD